MSYKVKTEKAKRSINSTLCRNLHRVLLYYESRKEVQRMNVDLLKQNGKKKIVPWIFPSDIYGDYGYVEKAFEQMHQEGIGRAVFSVELSPEISDNLKLQTAEDIVEIDILCKKHEITPLFVFQLCV